MNTLVTGASRGIGYGLVEEALKQASSDRNAVFAVARDVSNLISLHNAYPKSLRLIQADVSRPEGIDAVSLVVGEAMVPLDLLINNAGVYKKEETSQAFAESFHVNATTPFLLTKALLPYLIKSKSAKVAQISTLMGSIADNLSGGSYAYRSSKAALNMITKSLAIDYPGISFVLIHPGWVKTEMGGPEAPVEIKESVTGIWSVIKAVNPKDSGSYKDFRGRDLKW